MECDSLVVVRLSYFFFIKFWLVRVSKGHQPSWGSFFPLFGHLLLIIIIIMGCAKWIVGLGSKVQFWTDRWVDDILIYTVSVPIENSEALISDFLEFLDIWFGGFLLW